MRNPPTFSTHDPDSTQISKLTQIHRIRYVSHPRSTTSRGNTQIHAHLANTSQNGAVYETMSQKPPTRKFIPRSHASGWKLPKISAHLKTPPRIAPPILYIPRIQTF